MNNSNPFARSKAMLAAIAAAVSSGLSIQNLSASGLFDYKSRGHGGKHRAKSAKQQRIHNASKYQPHQGKKEIARRLVHTSKAS